MFIVDKYGDLKSIEAIDTVGIHQSLVKEAIRVVSTMPQWKPGMLNGVAVDVYEVLPISFKVDRGWLNRMSIKSDAKKALRKKAKQKKINEEYGIYD